MYCHGISTLMLAEIVGMAQDPVLASEARSALEKAVDLILKAQEVAKNRDNAGGYGVLEHGDAQYMVAGRYAMHYELAHELKPVRTLQLWVNLPKADKLGPTSYVDLRRATATVIEQPGVTARLHVGDLAGHTGPTSGSSRSR